MLRNLLARWNRPQSHQDLYAAIVAAARQPRLYREWGVPDTAMGRFEMVALHVAVMQQRLQELTSGGEAAARALGETFVTDMDDCMREIGVGDLGVPKKVKRAAAALFDRYNDYGTALTAGDHEALSAAIATHVGASAKPAALVAPSLATYVMAFDRAIRDQPGDSLLSGVANIPLLADHAPA